VHVLGRPPRRSRGLPTVLYRELDYFEQLGALEKHGAVDFEMIRTLLGRRLIDRWELWQPAIGGGQAYPMFDRLVTKMRAPTGHTV
jgi:hypothetical protein